MLYLERSHVPLDRCESKIDVLNSYPFKAVILTLKGSRSLIARGVVEGPGECRNHLDRQPLSATNLALFEPSLCQPQNSPNPRQSSTSTWRTS